MDKTARPQVELPCVFWRAPKKLGGYMHFDHEPKHLAQYEGMVLESDARQAIAESEARAEGLRKLLTEMIELRQATQDGRVTERHELEIVRDAKAAIAQEAEREAASA